MNTQTLSNQPTVAMVAPAADFTCISPTMSSKEAYQRFVKSYKENIKRLSQACRDYKQDTRASQKDSKVPHSETGAASYGFFKQLREAIVKDVFGTPYYSGTADGVVTKLNWPQTVVDPDKGDRMYTITPHVDPSQLASYLIATRRIYKVKAQEAYLKTKEAA